MAEAFRIVRGPDRGRLVLTCEHASCVIPPEYANLGLGEDRIRDHIGWDIGARDLTEALAQRCNAAAVLGGVSRLVIDCNRDLPDRDLIVAESHGVRIPGNAHVDTAERQHRIRAFYRPYHEAIDAVVTQQRGTFLFSVHSFTPVLNGLERCFDAGVLFDEYAAEAHRFGRALAATGLRVRYNQPYSGVDGLIFSAHTHGQRHGIRYLELEVNNSLLRDKQTAEAMAERVALALSGLLRSA